MGIDYYIHVGPFVRCVNTKVMKDVAYTGCLKCIKESNQKFCAICGTKISTFTQKQEQDLVEYEDHYEAFEKAGLGEDDLTSDINSVEGKPENEDWLTANSYNAPGASGDAKESKLWLKDEQVDVQGDIAKFEEMYAKHLDVLRSLYGPENVTVEWAIITYAN